MFKALHSSAKVLGYRSQHVLPQSVFASPHAIPPLTRTISNMAMQEPVPIASTPATGQLVKHDGRTYETVREGRAYILIPPNTRTSVDPQAKAKAGEHSSIKHTSMGSLPLCDTD